MSRLFFVLLFISGAALADENSEQRVAVVPYQGVGAEPGVVERLATSLRGDVASRKWLVVSPEETGKRTRAAMMCGEDVECLGTIGQRLDARYVLAFGVGRVGQGLMISALLIDARSSKRLTEFSERLPAIPGDAATLATRVGDTLFAGLTVPVKLIPKEVVPQPVVITPVVMPEHKLRPVAIGTAIGAGVLGVGGGVLTVMASENYRALPGPGEDGTQRGLNTAADVTMITAGVAAAVAVVLFIVDGANP